MKEYLEILQEILNTGEERTDRTGVGTISVFGMQKRFNLQKGFPAVTTKRLAWKSVVSELLWFLEGSTSERRLCEILHGYKDDEKETIWTANAKNQGIALGYNGDYLGPVYGKQWRNFKGVDQIVQVIESIKSDPYSRRHIVSAWNPADLPEMALPPCHVMFQFYVNNGKLSCHLYQRSVDSFLGLPFNIASYALLTHIIAIECGLGVGDFVWTGGDCHVYKNHVEQVKEQLTRLPDSLPNLKFIPRHWEDYKLGDFVLEDYKPMPSIKAPMAI